METGGATRPSGGSEGRGATRKAGSAWTRLGEREGSSMRLSGRDEARLAGELRGKTKGSRGGAETAGSAGWDGESRSGRPKSMSCRERAGWGDLRKERVRERGTGRDRPGGAAWDRCRAGSEERETGYRDVGERSRHPGEKPFEVRSVR